MVQYRRRTVNTTNLVTNPINTQDIMPIYIVQVISKEKR